MTQLMLKTEASQRIRLTLGAITYNIRLYQFRSLMYMDLQREDEYVFAGKRIMTNQWLIPYYITSGDGNIRFETYSSDQDSYVWYDGFNTKFRLMAYSTDDLPEQYWMDEG